MSEVELEFLRALHAELVDAPEEGGGVAAEFTRTVLERLAESGFVENPVSLWAQGAVGAARFRISGYALDEEQERLTLFTTLFSGQSELRQVSLEEVKVAVERALRLFLECTRGKADRVESPTPEVVDLARTIGETHHRISFVRVVVLSDYQMHSKKIDRGELEGTQFSVDLLGIERLQRILGDGLTREDIVIDVVAITGAPLACLPVDSDSSGYQAWLTALPGEVLASAYEEYGGRLLELNVRAFLGVRGRKSVNAGLQTTLETRPGDFLAFNNGIVATVDDVDAEWLDGVTLIRSLKGLQIVNGGQTTASIHRAGRALSVDLSAVRVPTKIIMVPRDDLSRMVTDISRSANSQNTVQPADFSANDPFHVRVEELANNVWRPDGVTRWFYERARGSYGALEAKAGLKAADRKRFGIETPKELRFAKTDLARYLNGWDGYPHQVSAGSQKNFQLFMQRLKDDRALQPDEAWYRRFIALAILYRTTQKIVREEKFSAYQANIAAYTFSSLSWITGGRIDFDLIWKAQAVSEELIDLIRCWSHEIDTILRETAGSRMPTEWAKRPEAWEFTRARLPALSDPLPPELAGASSSTDLRPSAGGDTLGAADFYLIEDCRKLSAEKLLEVVSWGHKNGLPKWHLGILNTITGYAASGWERSPSTKQARWVMDAVTRFEAPQKVQSL